MTAKKRKLNYLLESILVSSVIGIIIPSVYAIRDLITGVIKQPHLMMVGFVFSFTVSFVIYFFNVRLVKWMQARDNRYRSQLLRIVIEVMVTSALAAILMGIVFNMFTFISNMNQVMHMVRTAMFDSIVIALIVNSVVLIILETLFFFRKWKFSLVEAEHLRRKTIESQYAALTSQINPHFLFNSLNALSSLINEDKKKALKFTSEFSRIYRYVLDSKEKLIVTVDEELNFIHSYLYLQKIRFGNSLVYKTEVDMGCLDYSLPPLSLQLLVENAIKHNVISEARPLNLFVSGNCDEISVINTYQPLSDKEQGTGLGLRNLVERYSHFTDRKPEFGVRDGNYVATIPLIKDE